MATLAIRNKSMPPNFAPGWNTATLMWIVGALVTVAGLSVAAFITARYSLLSKVLEMQEALRKGESDRADKSTARFDALDSKLQSVEQQLHSSREELLSARNEVLTLRNENLELREQNVRLSGECATLKRQVALLQGGADAIGS